MLTFKRIKILSLLIVVSVFFNVSNVFADGLTFNDLYSIPNTGVRSLYLSYIEDQLTTSGGVCIPSNDIFERYVSLYSNPYLLDSETFNYDDGSVDVSGYHTIIMMAQGADNPMCVVLRLSADHVAFVDNYLVSDAPITLYYYLYRWWNNRWEFYGYNPNVNPRSIFEVNTVSSVFTGDDYYHYSIDSVPTATNYNFDVTFTDINIFYTSNDNSSGLSSYDSFDFLNTRSYSNINYLKTDGLIDVPADEEPDLVNQTAISNLMFRDSTFYACSSFKHILHYNRFVFNDYQLTNSENFVLKMNYRIVYKDDFMNDPVTLTYKAPGSNEDGYTYSLQLYLGYLTRFGNPSCLDLSSLHFKDSNGYTLDHYIRQTMSNITSINSDYANSDNILNNPIDDILSGIGNQIGQWVFGADSSYTYKGINQIYQSHLQTFKIYGYVEIAYKDNPLYVSGQYSDSFDFISDSYNVESTSNQLNNYPSDEESNLPVSSGDSSGSSNINTGGGSVANAYGGNVTFNGIIQKVFEPFTLDTVTVAGVGDNWNYMIRSIQDNSSNGFWGVLRETYSIIPSQVWGWLIAAVSAILGCAVFKFYITSIRC